MPIVEYIIQSLALLEEEYPEVRFRYAIEHNYHIIEVTPADMVDQYDFLASELHLWRNIEENYPDVDLIISEPSICLDMNNLIYETKT